MTKEYFAKDDLTKEKYFIIGKSCDDYNKHLTHLKRTPIQKLELNEDSFTNWIINRHPIPTIRRVYNEGTLELQDG